MIYLWLCDRHRFVDFITNRKALNRSDVRSADTIADVSLRGDDITLVWQKSPTDTFAMPRAVMVAEGSTSDFLAWVSTYFRHIRPFTAHCRVLPPSLAHLLIQPIPPPSLPDVGSADIGLILAEGMAYSVGRTDLNRLPFLCLCSHFIFRIRGGCQAIRPNVHRERYGLRADWKWMAGGP